MNEQTRQKLGAELNKIIRDVDLGVINLSESTSRILDTLAGLDGADLVEVVEGWVRQYGGSIPPVM